MLLRDTSLDIADDVQTPTPIAIVPAPTRAELFERTNTLHELLGFALDDFEAIIANKHYGIDVGGTYHTPRRRGGYARCTVCMAGAVMANTLEACQNQEMSPDDFSANARARLEAVNDLRCGDVADAWHWLHGGLPPQAAEELTERWMPRLVTLRNAENRRDARGLLGQLRIMQAELQAAGL